MLNLKLLLVLKMSETEWVSNSYHGICITFLMGTLSSITLLAFPITCQFFKSLVDWQKLLM